MRLTGRWLYPPRNTLASSMTMRKSTPTWFEVVEAAFSGSSDLDYIGGRSLSSRCRRVCQAGSLTGIVRSSVASIRGRYHASTVRSLPGLTRGNAVVRRELLTKIGPGFRVISALAVTTACSPGKMRNSITD